MYADHKGIANVHGASLYQHRRYRPAGFIELCLDNQPLPAP
jgi:hypothetical protein